MAVVHGQDMNGLGSQQSQQKSLNIMHLTCTGSPGLLVGSQRSQQRGLELQVGRHADMQCDRSRFTV